jgi:adenylate cyclase
VAEQRIRRRLAAILAADVVGYSRMMRADEAGTLAQLKTLLKEVFEPRTAEHDGRIVKTTGDGVLVEFASAVDATECAVKIQRSLARRNEDVPEGHRIALRIGINLGDIIVDGDDIHGDGVNVAARLEELCETGEVFVSAVVRDQVAGKVDVAFEDLGEHVVKNIDTPIRVYRASDGAEVSVAPATVAGSDAPMPLPEKPSVAVLPFENMSGDPEQEYFSDGITEDIITELTKISGLFVIARHSAFTYKGKSVLLKQVGRELGVRYVLEGSVRKAGNRLRITAQLIDAADDHHIWAERYDRELEDIFAVQDEVARQVAGALAVALEPGEAERLAHAPTDNLDSYDLYMRTRMSFFPPTRANVVTARGAYGHVIDIDPGFTGGHAGTSITHSMAVMFGHSEDPEEDARTALAYAERAVAIDDQFALSHSALGFAYSAARRHDEAIAAARRAVALQPGNADSHFFLAYCQLRAGDGDAARDSILTALRLDPQYVAGPYLNALGRACFVAGRYQESIDTFERNVAHGGPLGVPMLSTWLASLVALERLDEAREIARRLVEFDPGFSLSRAGDDAFGLPSGASSKRIFDALRKVGLPE